MRVSFISLQARWQQAPACVPRCTLPALLPAYQTPPTSVNLAASHAAHVHGVSCLQVFCQPPLGTVGYSEEECKAKFSGDMDVFVAKFKPMKNTLSGREERTLMKMVVHKATQKVLGVHMVGPDAAEIMQGISIALKAGATKAHFDATIGIHPSSAEEFVTMRKPERTIVGEGSGEP